MNQGTMSIVCRKKTEGKKSHETVLLKDLELVIQELLPFEGFLCILILPAWMWVNKLVIPGGIPFLGWIPCLWAGNSRQNPHLFPAESPFIPCSVSVGSSRSKRPPDGNESRIPYSCVVQVLAHRIPNVLWMETISEFFTPVWCKCWHIEIQKSSGW
jgi:hypothetical protein